MEDNEYNPEFYKLQKKDLIPIAGLLIYGERASRYDSLQKAIPRVLGLGLGNIAFFYVASELIKGLEKLL